MVPPTRPSRQSILGLDLVNIFMADVRDGVGVYLSVYLIAVLHWEPTQVGLVVALPGVISILTQAHAGSLIDETPRKRLLLVLVSLVVAVSCLIVIYFPALYPVTAAQALMGLVGPVFQPCVSALSLGLVGHGLMRMRVGRNESFNHAGNMLAAAIAVIIGIYGSYTGIFYFALVQCAAMIVATLLIRERDIDHHLARAALVDQVHGSFQYWGYNGSFVAFVGIGVAVTLFFWLFVREPAELSHDLP